VTDTERCSLFFSENERIYSKGNWYTWRPAQSSVVNYLQKVNAQKLEV